jgi:hypothetical protein
MNAGLAHGMASKTQAAPSCHSPTDITAVTGRQQADP